MRVKIGDIVASEFGQGPIVAMSKTWCIHEDEAGNEIAVEWADVRIAPAVDVAQSKITEMDFGESVSEIEMQDDYLMDTKEDLTDEGADDEQRAEEEGKEPGQAGFEISEQT